MQQRTSGQLPFSFASHTPPIIPGPRTGPGLARVLMELARPGSIAAEFDNRSSRPPHSVTITGAGSCE